MTFRAYFNSRAEAPHVWAIDRGTPHSEINVKGFRVAMHIPVRSVYAPGAQPCAWIAFDASHFDWCDNGFLFFS